MRDFPIVSIEDGLVGGRLGRLEEAAASGSGTEILLVGDDIFVTNPKIIARGIDGGRRQRGADQAQPDRHPVARRRMRCDMALHHGLAGHGVAPLRGDRGHDDRRPRGGLRQRADQDRLGVARATGSPSTTGCCASRTSSATPRGSPAESCSAGEQAAPPRGALGGALPCRSQGWWPGARWRGVGPGATQPARGAAELRGRRESVRATSSSRAR